MKKFYSTFQTPNSIFYNFAFSISIFSRLGGEFIPTLFEGWALEFSVYL